MHIRIYIIVSTFRVTGDTLARRIYCTDQSTQLYVLLPMIEISKFICESKTINL